jgi:hypothetical protein
LTGTEYKTHNTFNSTWVHPGFSEFRISRSLVLCLIFCRSLSVLLPFFFWPLYCLSFFDFWLLIASLVSSIFSYDIIYTGI